jgi:hypothetical protein
MAQPKPIDTISNELLAYGYALFAILDASKIKISEKDPIG